MGVDECYLEGRVAEKLTNDVDVTAFYHELAGEVVTHVVPPKVFDSGLLE